VKQGYEPMTTLKILVRLYGRQALDVVLMVAMLLVVLKLISVVAVGAMIARVSVCVP
jgi:hypothetical protein